VGVPPACAPPACSHSGATGERMGLAWGAREARPSKGGQESSGAAAEMRTAPAWPTHTRTGLRAMATHAPPCCCARAGRVQYTAHGRTAKDLLKLLKAAGALEGSAVVVSGVVRSACPGL
jgi:hypothetical protein